MRNKIMTVSLAILLICGLVAGITHFIGSAEPAQAAAREEQSKNAISANGSHAVKVAPDIAYISIGVETFSKDPKEAQKENSEKMDKVYKKLQSLGIEEKDIKTSNYNIHPRYEWNEIEATPQKGVVERKSNRILIGYEVNNMVTVTIRDLDKVGAVLDATVEAGVNEANSVSFGLSKEKSEKQYLEALKKAVTNAKMKAEAMASVYGITLGKPSNIIESGAYAPEAIKFRFTAEMNAGKMQDNATPISPGEMEIRANVNVVYEY